MSVPASALAKDTVQAAPTMLHVDSSKRALSVVSHVRDQYFDGDFRQSIHCMLRDYDIWRSQLCLTKRDKASVFINALGTPACGFF